MNLKSLLVLVVPVTFGTLEGFSWIIQEIFAQSGRVEDKVTLGTLDTRLSAIDMVRTWANGGALQLAGIGGGGAVAGRCVGHITHHRQQTIGQTTRYTGPQARQSSQCLEKVGVVRHKVGERIDVLISVS